MCKASHVLLCQSCLCSRRCNVLLFYWTRILSYDVIWHRQWIEETKRLAVPVPVAARSLRRGSTTARLLRLWVRIPPEAWAFVCCECCVLSGRALCDGPITRPEESYRLWCVVVCDLGTSWMRMPWPTGGCHIKNKQTKLLAVYVLLAHR